MNELILLIISLDESVVHFLEYDVVRYIKEAQEKLPPRDKGFGIPPDGSMPYQQQQQQPGYQQHPSQQQQQQQMNWNNPVSRRSST